MRLDFLSVAFFCVICQTPQEALHLSQDFAVLPKPLITNPFICFHSYYAFTFAS